MARRKARELAFRTLFEAEQGKAPLEEAWHHARHELAERDEESDQAYGDRLDAAGIAFAERLLSHFKNHRGEIDGRLERVIQGWSFSQMAQTDLTVLRLALTEMLYEPEVPKEVTIEMAVRIAKKYGGEESGRFVNGVLADLYDEVKKPLAR
jgi:transcription antitermination protein NusB